MWLPACNVVSAFFQHIRVPASSQVTLTACRGRQATIKQASGVPLIVALMERPLAIHPSGEAPFVPDSLRRPLMERPDCVRNRVVLQENRETVELMRQQGG
jgi:hypothetical protein